MTKKIPSPPIAVLLDLLFLLLFILLLDSKNNLEINIPKEKLFTGAILIEKYGDIEYIIDKVNFKRKDIFLPKDESYIYYKKCTTQCLNDKEEKNLYILFPSLLLNKISKITFIAMNTSEYNCKNLKFEVMNDGEIDKESFFSENKCASKINGLESIIGDAS